METQYKPSGYTSVSPYYIVDDALKLIDLLVQIFDAEELRKYTREDGSVLHAEIKIDDSVLMIADQLKDYPPNPSMTHIYVPDVDATMGKAIALGCELIEDPSTKKGDLDRRGGFRDGSGNSWYVATQGEAELEV